MVMFVFFFVFFDSIGDSSDSTCAVPQRADVIDGGVTALWRHGQTPGQSVDAP